MMGIYSVDPASLAYEIVSPSFSKIVIHLGKPYPGAAFTITASDAPDATPYIQRTVLNGHPQTRNWIEFSDITSGGTLHFTLGFAPNRQWGSAREESPPSLTGMQ
jgi:putative alpha-1,2-mannosidase